MASSRTYEELRRLSKFSSMPTCGRPSLAYSPCSSPTSSASSSMYTTIGTELVCPCCSGLNMWPTPRIYTSYFMSGVPKRASSSSIANSRLCVLGRDAKCTGLARRAPVTLRTCLMRGDFTVTVGRFSVAAMLIGLLVLTACSSPQPLNLAGIYGGYITDGVNVAGFGLDLISSDGSVTGDGILTDGTTNVYLSVTGTTTVNNEVSLRLTDIYGDYIRLSGTMYNQVVSGTWSSNLGGGGFFEMTHEDNVENLDTKSTSTKDGELRALALLQ